MKRLSLAFIPIVMTLAFALPAMAQDDGSSAAQPAATKAVQQGNTTIFFKPAGSSNLDHSRLQTWGEFAEAHPKVAKDLAYNSSLIDDSAYLSKHPALGAFFQAHPDVKDAMAENPGNFVAIPPRPGE
jgi:hypothetical protein